MAALIGAVIGGAIEGALNLIGRVYESTTEAVAIVFGAVLAAGATLLAAVGTMVITLVWETLAESPTFQVIIGWIGYIYFWGALGFAGLEVGMMMSRLRDADEWIMSLMNVALWPLMWSARALAAHKFREIWEMVKDPSNSAWDLDRINDVSKCNWHQWLWIPKYDRVSNSGVEVNDVFWTNPTIPGAAAHLCPTGYDMWGVPAEESPDCVQYDPYPDDDTQCTTYQAQNGLCPDAYYDEGLGTHLQRHQNIVGPVNCYLRGMVYNFINGKKLPTVSESDGLRALRDRVRCEGEKLVLSK